ncbi:hypothetical protein A2V47_07845 [Candidatus Atribacteria bacterium RBG_19FT_COMBO_35_14]|uniref:Uncharacterized protein n=1 Tax=Candidatus Sediminicultor quintus TaxID=1797291 RepID=A0A1F5ADA8_9BACT|nr:MAG: hypothetical protein A2V47_07845 [Candidatus Atribacteria bacterium RBG_19FT_COMBO_35_14]
MINDAEINVKCKNEKGKIMLIETTSFMCALSRGILIDRFIVDINWINPQGNRANHNEIELKK